MRYLKLFEDIHPLLYDIHHDEPNLRLLIGKWLDKIKPQYYSVDYSYHKNGIKLNDIPSISLNGSFRNRRSLPVFSIGVKGVNDKKQINNPKPLKQRVHLDYTYNTIGMQNLDFVEHLKEFIVEIFKKYSYFDKKKNDYYRKDMQSYDFYILTADIPNIMKDLETEFEYYIDAKKYNL
jgi:hypothetical protein